MFMARSVDEDMVWLAVVMFPNKNGFRVCRGIDEAETLADRRGTECTTEAGA